MNGMTLKSKLLSIKVTQREIAEMLGVKQQTVSSFFAASDLRTSTVEKLASVLNIPVAYFYSDSVPMSAVASGDGSAASVNGDAVVGCAERVKYLERLLEEKERTIQILMKK